MYPSIGRAVLQFVEEQPNADIEEIASRFGLRTEDATRVVYLAFALLFFLSFFGSLGLSFPSLCHLRVGEREKCRMSCSSQTIEKQETCAWEMKMIISRSMITMIIIMI